MCTLPAELVSHILCYTNSRDLIRWRTVSKWFLTITQDAAIWKVLYVNAPFIRPPGPFLSQTTASLERALVRSARLAQSWTAPCLRIVSHVEIPFVGRPTEFLGNIDLIGGRWLIVCQSERRFVLYDTDADVETYVPQILWEQDSEEHCRWQIGIWDKYSVVSEEGQCVVYVLLSKEYNSHAREWRLIESRLSSGEPGALRDITILDIPGAWNRFGTSPQIQGGPSPFFLIPPLQLVFDTRTRLFYNFPEFHIALDETRRKVDHMSPPQMEAMLTNTHVFGFFSYWLGERGQYMTLIQAFTVPDDQPLADNKNGILRLSHEGILLQSTPHAVIRNSIVDPITGSISVRFLCQWLDYHNISDGLQPKCVDVTLHEPSPVDVSPITVYLHAVLTSENEPLHRDFGFGYDFFDSFCDGYARGLFTKNYHYPEGADDYTANRHAIAKFTIDATRDRCVATLGQLSPLPVQWKHFHRMDPRVHRWMRFDGIRGRLCYIRLEGTQRNQFLVVMDVE